MLVVRVRNENDCLNKFIKNKNNWIMPTLKYRISVNISGIFYGWEEMYVDRSIWTVYYLRRKHFCANTPQNNRNKLNMSNKNEINQCMFA